jgi:hypothetical protein
MMKKSLSIWFFIGAIMAVYGLIILAAGIYAYVVPPVVELTLANLHAAIWWGLLMLVIGLFYVVKFRPRAGDDIRIVPEAK